MKHLAIFILIILKCFCFTVQAAAAGEIKIHIPKVVVANLESKIEITSDSVNDSVVELTIDGKNYKVLLHDGRGVLSITFFEKTDLVITSPDQTIPIRPIPLWLSILPPLLAIVLALVFREVITSLFFGLFVGSAIIEVYNSGEFLLGLGKGLMAIMDDFVVVALNDSGHLSIIVFSMMIGAMVSIITKNGGMKGVVAKLSRFANDRKSGQFSTWLLGIAIFFDDYANTLVVGNTMRPLTDKLKISRQKLAYIVDSTAAPIAAIGFVTTWIGAELSYIESGISTLGLNLSPYNVFLNSLAYAFYPVFALIFILFLIFRGVDFGPMVSFERHAKREGVEKESSSAVSSGQMDDLEVKASIIPRWYNAAIPVLVVIVGTFIGLIYTGQQNVTFDDELGFGQKLSQIIGASDSYKALMWSSLTATLVALVLTVSQKILTLHETIDSIVNGFKTMLTAIIILILAWSIALVTENLHTADFISKVIVETNLSPVFVPLITFVLAALVAFSTGSSWGTMAILYPLIIPATWLITKEYEYTHAASLNIFYNAVASVLAGSVLGDHCSPISDTTILSSLASSCPHIEHVKTQLPYALTVGSVAALFGVLPAALGIKPYVTFPVGLIILYIIVRLFGKKI